MCVMFYPLNIETFTSFHKVKSCLLARKTSPCVPSAKKFWFELRSWRQRFNEGKTGLCFRQKE